MPPLSQQSLLQMRSHAHVEAPGADAVEVHFRLRDGSLHTVRAAPGNNLLEVAHANQIDLEGACECSLACSTCHIVLSQEIFDALPEATEEEEDLLDLAPELKSTSRLACQVIVDKSIDGAEVILPQTTVNFYVDGFVPQPH